VVGSLTELPAGLPVPIDDGGCDHLPGASLPTVPLQSTAGRAVDLAALPGLVAANFYPMTGRPGVPLPDGWDTIPGARGCTPQACGFRDHAAERARQGAAVFGVSTQPPAGQAEAATRLHLPFELLSDQRLELSAALRLPTFESGGRRLVRRLTLVLARGRVEQVFYPVFAPDMHAAEVVTWLAARHAEPGAGSDGEGYSGQWHFRKRCPTDERLGSGSLPHSEAVSAHSEAVSARKAAR
jgi:peroxiredoxin